MARAKLESGHSAALIGGVGHSKRVIGSDTQGPGHAPRRSSRVSLAEHLASDCRMPGARNRKNEMRHRPALIGRGPTRD